MRTRVELLVRDYRAKARVSSQTPNIVRKSLISQTTGAKLRGREG